MRALNSAVRPHWQETASRTSLLLGDVCSLACAAILALGVALALSERSGFAAWVTDQSYVRYVAAAGLSAWVLWVIGSRLEHYATRKPFWMELQELWSTLAMAAVLDLALTAAARWNASRWWWLAFWMLAALTLPLVRWLVRRCLSRAGWWQRPTVVVGVGANAAVAVQALSSEWQLGVDLLGQVDPELLVSQSGEGTGAGNVSLPELGAWAAAGGLHVVLALDHEKAALHKGWMRQLSKWGVRDVNVVPALSGIPLNGTRMAWFYSHEVAVLQPRDNLRPWSARLTKRCFDVLVSALLVLVLAPVLVWVAWRIRADGGPVLFAHQRVGRGGRLFKCYKFRTMTVDAEPRLQSLLASNELLRAEWDVDRKLRNDPRVSSVGKLLRQTSLDELPQLFNVLRGDMSLVGPRPVVEDELARYGEDSEYYLLVRPGITGLWQVSGRNDAGYERRVFLDTWYVKNWSLWQDVAILMRTVRVVLLRHGAY